MPWRKNTVDSVRPNSLSHTWNRSTFLLQLMEYPGWLAEGLCVSGHSVRELEEVLIIREGGCGFLFLFYYEIPPPHVLWLLLLLPPTLSWPFSWNLNIQTNLVLWRPPLLLALLLMKYRILLVGFSLKKIQSSRFLIQIIINTENQCNHFSSL